LAWLVFAALRSRNNKLVAKSHRITHFTTKAQRKNSFWFAKGRVYYLTSCTVRISRFQREIISFEVGLTAKFYNFFTFTHRSAIFVFLVMAYRMHGPIDSRPTVTCHD